MALPARDGVSGTWTYLRLVQDETTKTWLPQPVLFVHGLTSASMIRVLDPCMGSGHFLVFALPVLVRLRIEEEKQSARAAVIATKTRSCPSWTNVARRLQRLMLL